MQRCLPVATVLGSGFGSVGDRNHFYWAFNFNLGFQLIIGYSYINETTHACLLGFTVEVPVIF